MNGPLASWATPLQSPGGRAHPEDPPPFRTEHMRDRDRIVHSAAFRRLEQKCQVFASYEGDMFRSRLTHTLEVAQIARTVASALQLNEALTEAIALAHDLGHAPFGHAGQHALDACMATHGGFEHNAHGLRIVDLLEDRYAAFPGLNLTLETRQGILKHCSRARAGALGAVAVRFIEGGQPSLEAQVANIADEIAYNNHDVDDGLRAGLLQPAQVLAYEPFARAAVAVQRQWPQLDDRRLMHEVIRRSIDANVTDLIRNSQERLADARVTCPGDVQAFGEPLVALSPAMREHHLAVKRFLRDALYQHHRVHRMAMKGRRLVRELFAAFADEPRLLPPECQREDVPAQMQAISDYIAGMTDRFAVAEYRRVFEAGVPT
ncbi:MAG TPA: deoxyguanosinetriphosphate triphosphohydrolase [Gammaproteobacteria bacterium]|nr:deoxyguanosinetriphosphate triphosphohydrolase [Gammaproteobacteria bacterium]